MLLIIGVCKGEKNIILLSYLILMTILYDKMGPFSDDGFFSLSHLILWCLKGLVFKFRCHLHKINVYFNKFLGPNKVKIGPLNNSGL